MTARGAVYARSCAEVDRRSQGRCESPPGWKAVYGCDGRVIVHHHILRRRAPVDDLPDNLAGLCLECHRTVHDNPEAAYAHGLLRRSSRPSKITRTVEPAVGTPREATK